jgi:hypothetical protein
VAENDTMIANPNPSTTVPAARQPTESGEHAIAEPDQTVVVIERNPDRDEVCGARVRGRADQFCADLRVEGRRRCRVHGGLTPVGRESPHFVHGRDARFPVPLSEREQARYEQYVRAVFDPARSDLASDLALARIQRDRAVAAGDRAVAEAGAVARLALAHATITKGTTIRLAPDEVFMGRFMDTLMGVMEACVFEALEPAVGKALLASVALRMRAINWSKVGEPN